MIRINNAYDSDYFLFSITAVLATRTSKTNVPADLCSAGIEYKDL